MSTEPGAVGQGAQLSYDLAREQTGGSGLVSLRTRWAITYFLQRGTNLTAQPAFNTIQTNLLGQGDVSSFTDTNAVGAGPFFYRVGVQQ